MLCAVAFLSPADIVQSFAELIDEIRNTYNKKVDKFLNYFKDNCIGRLRKNAPFFTLSFALDL